MKDPVGTFERFLEQRKVRDAAVHKGDVVFFKKRRDILHLPREQVVKDNNLVLLPCQFFNNMGPDKPGPAGDNVLHDIGRIER